MKLSKEERRLQAPIFETMVPVPDTVREQLRGWQPPQGAYILFQTRVKELSLDEWVDGIFTFGIAERPEQYEKVTYYVVKKGYKPIHYGNFPKANHPNPRVAQKAIMHTGPDKVNPWDTMEDLVKAYMNANAKVTARETELQKKLDEALKAAELAQAKPTSKTKAVSNDAARSI